MSETLQSFLSDRMGRSGWTRVRIVDLGGGTGGLAVELGRAGHDVVVVDPSPDALASLARRAADEGVQVRGLLGDATSLVDAVGAGSADLVVCHGVLEVVDAPEQALAATAAVLVPGGAVSVLASQRSAGVFSRALAGHFAEARAMLADRDGRWGPGDPMPRRFTADQLTTMLDETGFAIDEIRGVRIFTDHVSSGLVDGDPHSGDELHELERAVATDPDFMAIAVQLHVLATRR